MLLLDCRDGRSVIFPTWGRSFFGDGVKQLAFRGVGLISIGSGILAICSLSRPDRGGRRPSLSYAARGTISISQALFSDALLPLGFIGPLPLRTEPSKVADTKLAPDLVHIIGSTLVGNSSEDGARVLRWRSIDQY